MQSRIPPNTGLNPNPVSTPCIPWPQHLIYVFAILYICSMKISVQLLLSCAAALVLVLCAVGTEGASVAENDVTAKKELLFLAKILAPLKELAREALELSSFVERVATDRDFAMDMTKRQGAWDMDYGWGGGRFGKRGSSTNTGGQSAKRYDSFGIAGRFGRSVDNAENH